MLCSLLNHNRKTFVPTNFHTVFVFFTIVRLGSSWIKSNSFTPIGWAMQNESGSRQSSSTAPLSLCICQCVSDVQMLPTVLVNLYTVTFQTDLCNCLMGSLPYISALKRATNVITAEVNTYTSYYSPEQHRTFVNTQTCATDAKSMPDWTSNVSTLCWV